MQKAHYSYWQAISYSYELMPAITIILTNSRFQISHKLSYNIIHSRNCLYYFII